MNELEQVLDFFRAIGIRYQLEALPVSGFLLGVLIKNGTLLIDPEQLSYPGDLLHEAGHIAVMPEASRHLLNDNVNELRVRVRPKKWQLSPGHGLHYCI